jgi:hypothetical protein
MVLVPAGAAAAAEPVSATAPLTAATAAALGMRTPWARINVPHDDVSFEDRNTPATGLIRSDHVADMLTLYR